MYAYVHLVRATPRILLSRLRAFQARCCDPTGRCALVIRTQLEQAGAWTLIKQQFVGVSGQVCSVTYELKGPRPDHFNDLDEARAAFRQAEALATEETV